MQSLHTPPPHAYSITEASYKNFWRWHDAEWITRPLDNRAAVRQHSTTQKAAQKTLQIHQDYMTIGKPEMSRRILYGNEPCSMEAISPTSVSQSAYISVIHTYALALS